MASTNIGKIRIRNLCDLQSENDSDIQITTVIDATPEKPAKKTTRPRAATTIKKKKSAIKRTCRKEPLPGQLRIDAFFKSCAKNHNVVETIPKAVKTDSTKDRRTTRRGCKRLFDEESTTATTTTTTDSNVEYNIRNIKKRTQPHRTTKANCNSPPTHIIDLCSDGEIEDKPLVSCNQSTSQILGELALGQLEPAAMVSIPHLDLQLKDVVDTSTKENAPKGRKRKMCPPYKMVEDTTFVVDGFQFGDIPDATHYFLSHYHADHYIGLTRKFSHPLYMSPITASLVRTFIPISEEFLHEIDVDETITLNDIEITAIDANHCPGALMLLFKFKTGKCILHTGDFRANFEMESWPVFWNNPRIDLVYLDTTYLSKNYDFCHQSDSIDRLCDLVQSFHEKYPSKRILYVCGAYLIGKEKIWLTLAEHFNLRIWTEPHRRKAINCLDWPELQMRLCDNQLEANLHVISMMKISYPQLDQYFKPFEGQYDALLAIRPSGWEKNSKPSYGKRISVIGIEYSEHSSYKELERFVRFVKPNRVISTVPVAKDLCVTGNVPENWYKFKGYGGMLSTGYQPTISTFFETPQRKLRSSLKLTCNVEMTVSPMKDDIDVIPEIYGENKEPKNTKCKADTPPKASRNIKNEFSSDASDDLLSYI